MFRIRALPIALAVAATAVAGCGGSDSDKGKGSGGSTTNVTTTTQPTTPATPASAQVTADDVVSCVTEKGAAQELKAEPGSLTLEGLDSTKYEVVVVRDAEGTIEAQVLVFKSNEDAAEGLARIADNGFFDDARPGGNAVIIVRGADEPTAETLQGCIPPA